MSLILLILILVVINYCSSGSGTGGNRKNEKHQNIKHYPVRRDTTNKPVERGKLEELGGLEDFMLKPSSSSTTTTTTTTKVNYDEFKQKLQCSESEPQLYSNGIYHLMQMYPITNDIIELAAAYAEKPCLDGHKRIDWASCQNTVKLLKANKRHELNQITKPVNYELENVRLIRVINGSLYYDWPWPSDKNWKTDNQYTLLRLIEGTLSKISDIPDSVFMSISFDYPLLPSFFPMALISHGPTISNSDIPFPWTLVVNDEIILHEKYFSKKKKSTGNDNYYDANSEHLKDLHPYDKLNNNYTDIYNKYYNPDNLSVWKQRVNKVAFYGRYYYYYLSLLLLLSSSSSSLSVFGSLRSVLLVK